MLTKDNSMFFSLFEGAMSQKPKQAVKPVKTNFIHWQTVNVLCYGEKEITLIITAGKVWEKEVVLQQQNVIKESGNRPRVFFLEETR